MKSHAKGYEWIAVVALAVALRLAFLGDEYSAADIRWIPDLAAN